MLEMNVNSVGSISVETLAHVVLWLRKSGTIPLQSLQRLALQPGDEHLQ